MTDTHALISRDPQGKQKTPILEALPTTQDGKRAKLRLYDRIDDWGGPFGVSAQEFAAALDSLGDDIDEIELHINSPGGMAFEGIAILNQLRQHNAKVITVVDGIAASAASMIAMGGDEIVMARNSEMMIHDASNIAIGTAADIAAEAGVLEKLSDNIASIYAERAGGTAAEWREAMLAETWYTADEAVAAGLADRVETKADASTAKASIDLSLFQHAGRADAPPPKLPAVSAAAERQVARGLSIAQAVAAIHNAPVRGASKSEVDMQFSEEELTDLRNKLGLSADQDVSPQAVLAALGGPQTPQAPGSPGAPAPAAPPSNTPSSTPAGPAVSAAPGVVSVDQSAWDAQQERIQRLEAADAKRRREERDNVIDQAINEGKFQPSRKEHWQRLWDADPEGARAAIDGLHKNAIPVAALGFADGGEDDDDHQYSHLFAPRPNNRKGA